MKKNTMIAALTALTLCIGMTAAPAKAHSDHDHSYLPVGWSFDPIVQAKIEKNMVRGTASVGLSRSEQLTLEGYGIKVGNSFNTTVGGMEMKIVRTSSGLRFEGAAMKDATKFQLPILENHNAVRPVSMGSHPGHDHARLSLAWVFNNAIENKIQANIFEGTGSGVVGLTSAEQNTLERYGINVGNSFRAYVDNMTFTVKRTSAGLQILSHELGGPVAKAPNRSANY